MKIYNRFLLIWKDNSNHRNYTVGYLTGKGGKFFFEYYESELETAQQNGMTFFPGFSEIKKYESEEMFSNILQRLPSSKRDNYKEIIQKYGIRDKFDVFEILTKTRGKTVTDSFEFVPFFNKKKSSFYVAGIRHNLDESSYKYIEKNLKLALEVEKNNIKDKDAVIIKFRNPDNNLYDDVIIGYVPRYYSKEIKECLEERKAYVIRIKKYDLNISLPKDERYIEVNLEFY